MDNGESIRENLDYRTARLLCGAVIRLLLGRDVTRSEAEIAEGLFNYATGILEERGLYTDPERVRRRTEMLAHIRNEAIAANDSMSKMMEQQCARARDVMPWGDDVI